MEKKGLALDSTGWLILGIVTLIIVLLLFFVFRKPMEDLIEQIINIFRFS